MQLRIGEYKGNSVELLMLSEPSYIHWMLKLPPPQGAMAEAIHHARALIDVFDAKPFLRTCSGSGCQNVATRYTLYRNSMAPFWWCVSCNPYQGGAAAGTLRLPSGYVGALNHIEKVLGRSKSDYRRLIKVIAQAKGLPHRVGEVQAKKFFHV